MDRRRRGAQALVRGSCALRRFTRQDASPGVPQDGSAREFTVLRRHRGAEGQAAPAGSQEQQDGGPGPGGEFQDIPGYECGGESGWTPQREPGPGGGRTRRPQTTPAGHAPNQGQPRTNPALITPPRPQPRHAPGLHRAPKTPRLDTRILIYREQKK